MKKILLTISIITLLSSCSHNPLMTKSENQLRRIVADMQDKISSQQEEIAHLRGNIEESEHRLNQKIDKNTESSRSNYEVMKARVEILEEYQNNQNEINKRVVEAITKNENLIITVDQNFKKFRDAPPKKQVKKEIEYATKLYEKKEYMKAKNIYQKYLDLPHLLTSKEYRVLLYRVALMEYRLNMNDESIAHFSQLYQKFYREDDKYMASSLYHIGSILYKDRKCGEAKKVFEQIKIDYSNHKYFKKMSDKKIKEMQKGSWCGVQVF